MKALMKIELERAFKNKWFYISVSITLLIVLYGYMAECAANS